MGFRVARYRARGDKMRPRGHLACHLRQGQVPMALRPRRGTLSGNAREDREVCNGKPMAAAVIFGRDVIVSESVQCFRGLCGDHPPFGIDNARTEKYHFIAGKSDCLLTHFLAALRDGLFSARDIFLIMA